jgi:peptidoglycan/LPS O-acetylase OafA/YrhL
VQKSTQIPSLDGFRAISILLVFASHVGFGHVIPGGFGVTIFFFLSGYLITILLTREYDQFEGISLFAFYGRRIIRLAPPILLTLVVCYVLLFLKLVEGGFDLGTLVSQIFFYYNYYSLWTATSQTVDGLGILWSLAVEEHFYLIWPMLFIALATMRRAIWYVVALLFCVLVWRCLRWYVFGSYEWDIYISSDTRMDSILYGCLLALMQWRGDAARIFSQSRSMRISILAGATVILLVCFAIRDDSFRSTIRFSLQGVALMPFFYYAIQRPDDLLFRVLNWKFMRRIGQWSFTIYLIHFVIIKALIFNGIAAEGTALLVVLSLGLSIGYAAIVYEWLEKPLHPLRRRMTGH